MMRGNVRHTHSGRLVVAAGGGVLLLCVALLAHIFSGTTPERPQAQHTALALAADAAAQDTDADGLYDWEEVLYNTDIHNPDTDNDGVSDGAEVRRGGNPLGADRKTDGGGETTAADTAASEAPATLTRQLSRELLGNYLATFSERGGNVSVQDQQVLAQSAIELAQSTFAPPTVDAATLTTVPTNETTQTYYFSSVARITEQLDMETVAEYQTLTFLAQQGMRTDTLENLRANATRYTEYGTALTDIAVPQEYVVPHTLLSEALLQYGYTLETISYARSDPMKSAVGMGVFLQMEQKLRAALAQFAELKVAFEAPEVPDAPPPPNI